ncbi:hypothetical protein OK074_8519 [Actinobacteria bacterium OK074]|nr:hypothetical protein OK074_8519 [Actinobacteria bacterium OK074]
MRPDDHRAAPGSRGGRDSGTGGQGGISDGLLVGVIAFLLGVTLLVWTATLLAARFARDAWPDGVTFVRTPLAMRHLLTHPHDIPGAWPDTPQAQLSGYGLFWGLFIGQLMVLFVLTIFAMGTVARWKAVRARSRSGAAKEVAPEPAPQPAPVPQPRPEPTQTQAQPPPPELPPAATPLPAYEQVPEPPSGIATAPTGLIFGPPETRLPTATTALRDAEGPALVVTSNPALWAETKDARAKLGPVLLYDPSHRCDTPARLHWSPAAGCEDKPTAASRATALLAPVRPTAKIDQSLAELAETLLRCYLHAAAVEGRTIRHIHRWAQGTQVQEAVRALRTNPKAASGSAGELEAALTAHPERRDMAQELTARALSSLFTVNVRESCTPNRADTLSLDSFVAEGGTLYVVGDPIEDPRQQPGAMPLSTALVSHVVERGRGMAERSPSGRLDPPLTLILEDVAAVAPFPQLPALLNTPANTGLHSLALLRSPQQLHTRWPQHGLTV